MVENVWTFIGIQRIEKTKFDKELSVIVNEAMKSIFSVTGLSPSGFSSFREMVEFGRQMNNEDSYFWDWMKEHGIGYLERIGKVSLPDEEDTMAFLAYRKLILESDMESNDVSNLFISVSELLKTVDEFVNSKEESLWEHSSLR
ncbi:hypothetical protein [Caldibacillus debilis]|uniref:Uncharacterized protein n=1 Tax=Caldibacillus debilis GB1 TaxID=1339248 RepID=A0A420VDY0_9BACI|nr:hypothetical protein [Caldibacillus debilis]RKO61776.1 hypothetical protein Cdeb_01269 [Caldibacillus debilis GB1]